MKMDKEMCCLWGWVRECTECVLGYPPHLMVCVIQTLPIP